MVRFGGFDRAAVEFFERVTEPIEAERLAEVGGCAMPEGLLDVLVVHGRTQDDDRHFRPRGADLLTEVETIAVW